MSNEIKFNCTGCGACCKLVGPMIFHARLRVDMGETDGVVKENVLVCWSHTPSWGVMEAVWVDGYFYRDRGGYPLSRVTHWMEMPKGVKE